jgi:hypothetical protein
MADHEPTISPQELHGELDLEAALNKIYGKSGSKRCPLWSAGSPRAICSSIESPDFSALTPAGIGAVLPKVLKEPWVIQLTRHVWLD